jgi:hypothetical protein
MEVTTEALSFPPVWTGTATPTEFPKYATSPTTLPQTVTETRGVTNTTEPSSTKTAIPTHRPTPTRGLPPTATRGPKEECPPLINEKADIQFAENISDYGPQILDYFRAMGDRAELEQQLERLGRYEARTKNNETGEKEKIFEPNIALFTEADVTGDQM